MGFYGDAWLRAARDRVEPSSEEPLSSTNFDQLAEAVEKAIKAALIESHGSLPAKHDHDQLVAICQNTGVWDVLPPALRALVQEMESYRSAKVNRTDVDGLVSTPRSLERYFTATRRLIDYMEYHVIGNNSVLRRLRVT